MAKDVDREMAEAGSRFEAEVRQAMDERDIQTLAELERRTGIKRRSWEDWFSGIHEPRPGTLSRAQGVLRRSPEQLLSRWDGQRVARTKSTGLPDASAVVEAINEVAREVRALRRALGLAGADARQVQAAADAVAVAQEDLAKERAGAPADEPAASSRQGRSDEGTLPL